MIKKWSYHIIAVITSVLVVASVLLITFFEEKKSFHSRFSPDDLPEILERDTLRVGTLYGSLLQQMWIP